MVRELGDAAIGGAAGFVGTECNERRRISYTLGNGSADHCAVRRYLLH